MKVVLLTLLALVAFAAAADLDLTSDNFDSTIEENDFVLVMFYAPWCGHCKKLKPAYAEAADASEGKFVLGKVDCTEHAELCQRFDVRGYPTLYFFKSGEKRKYDGPRTAEGIVSWLEKKSGPSSVPLATAEDLAAFQGNTPAAVGYFAGGSLETEAGKAFVAAADSPNLDSVRFGHVTDEALFGDAAAGTVVFHRGADVGDDVTYVVGDTEDLAQTIFASSFPAVGQVGPENFGLYADLGAPLYLAFVDLSDEDSKSNVVAALTAAQADHTDSSFGYIDGVQFKANMKRMGASGDVMPCIIRLDFASNKPIVFEEDITADAVVAWVNGVYDGSVKYVPKSEPVPEDNDGPVTTVVGSTFESIVKESDADVLVEFYAPWCGHCKKLAPEWDALGEAFADVDSVVIAKVDMTANDVEAGVEVKGFPTLLLYPAGAKDTPLSYEGGRTAKEIEAWLRTKATSLAEGHDEL